MSHIPKQLQNLISEFYARRWNKPRMGIELENDLNNYFLTKGSKIARARVIAKSMNDFMDLLVEVLEVTGRRREGEFVLDWAARLVDELSTARLEIAVLKGLNETYRVGQLSGWFGPIVPVECEAQRRKAARRKGKKK